MRILVACEFSGIVREAFRARGHDAISCDFLPSDRPGPHIRDDVRNHLAAGWDMLLAFPPCTFLCSSGLHWNKRVEGRSLKTAEALEFVELLLGANIPRIALENPKGRISTAIRPPDQIIYPWQFGHDASKETHLWLKGLKKLKSAKIVEPRYSCRCGVVFEFALGRYGCPNCAGKNRVRPIWGNQTRSGQNKLPPSPNRWKLRSETYSGVANAMAVQWGNE